jgi:hypothetical protein
MEHSPSGGEPLGAAGSSADPSSGDPNEVNRLRAENEHLQGEIRTLRAAPVQSRRSIGNRIRRVLTPVLVILTSITLVAATLGVWANRTIWNTDRYVALVAPLASDPAVTGALSDRLTSEAIQALDIKDRVENAFAQIPRLPEAARFLAGPIEFGAETLIQRQIETFLASQTFKNLWTQLNRTAHAKVVALLEGNQAQLPNVAVTGGEVRLNLIPLLAQLLKRIVQRGINGLGLDVTIPTIPTSLDASAGIQKLGSALGVTLPADFGQVTIMTEAQLTDYQKAARQAKLLSGALVGILIALIALCITLSVSRRRTVMWLGIGGVAALLVAGVFLRRIQGRVLDSINKPGAKAAAKNVFTQVGGSLRHAGLIVAGVALAAVVCAYLAGRPRWLRWTVASVRRVVTTPRDRLRFQTWVAHYADPIRIGSLTLAVLILFITGIDWVPLILVLCALGLIEWGVRSSRRVAADAPERLPGESAQSGPKGELDRRTTASAGGT